MTPQGDLFAARPAFVRADDRESIQERFEAFDVANPWVMAALVKLARDYRGRGVRRIGIKHLFEVLRWEFHKATDGEEFKLNNNFTSRYAREIGKRHLDVGEMFETRLLKAA